MLIERARAGCHEAFTELVNMYYGPVVKRCTSIVGDPSEGEDLAQEVFTDAFAGIGQFRGDAKFSTWLFQIAVNKASRRLKELKRRALIFDGDTDIDDDGETCDQGHCHAGPDEQAKAMLQELVDGLPPTFKQLIQLRLMGYKHKEIADMLDCPATTVRTKVHRAVEMMREEAF